MRLLRTSLLLFMAVIVAVSTACGSNGTSTPATATTSTGTGSSTPATKQVAAVRATAREFLVAYKERRFRDAVELMTLAAQREVAGTSRGNVAVDAAAKFASFRHLLSDAALDRGIARVETAPVKIAGTRARSRDLNGSPSYFVYRDGRWLIADKRWR
jgi:hypothetical protein